MINQTQLREAQRLAAIAWLNNDKKVWNEANKLLAYAAGRTLH